MEVWIGRDGERHGPYKEEDVRQWLRSGQLSRDDLGWYDGLADWQPLSVLFPDALRQEPPAFVPPNAASSALPHAATTSFDEYAGFWQRFGAWVIDLLVLVVPSMIAFYLMGGFDAYRHLMEQMQGGAAVMVSFRAYAEATQPASIASIIIGFVYYTLFECSTWQATPGKMALRLRVVDLDGRRLSLARSATRNAVRLVNIVLGLIPFICYLAVACTPRKQGLHDLLAHTLVLNGRASDVGKNAASPTSGSGGSFNA